MQATDAMRRTSAVKDEGSMQTKSWRLKDVDWELLSVCTWSASKKKLNLFAPVTSFVYDTPYNGWTDRPLGQIAVPMNWYHYTAH